MTYSQGLSPRVTLGTLSVAAAFAIPLFRVAQWLDFSPIEDLVWHLGADLAPVLRGALGYVLALGCMTFLVDAVLRLTGAHRQLHAGYAVRLLVVIALFWPVVLLGTGTLTGGLQQTAIRLFYNRVTLLSGSAILCGLAIALLVLGKWFEIGVRVRRRQPV